LRSGVVYANLQSIIVYPEQAVLEISQSSAFIFDFKNREMFYFYYYDKDSDLPLNQLEPILFAPFLVEFNAVMVHNAGLICSDRVALFMAPDEGGKTTVVNQAAAECCGVLSDDKVILRRTNGVFMAHGTPWSRFTDGPISTRLGSLFLLEKAENFELSPLKAVEVLNYLWNEHLDYWAYLTKAGRIQAFDFINTICHQIPAYRMRFPKDYVDWNAIRMACQNNTV
jgi:hypothetical protein